MKYSVIKYSGFADHKQTPILHFLFKQLENAKSFFAGVIQKNMKDVPNVLKSI